MHHHNSACQEACGTMPMHARPTAVACSLQARHHTHTHNTSAALAACQIGVFVEQTSCITLPPSTFHPVTQTFLNLPTRHPPPPPQIPPTAPTSTSPKDPQNCQAHCEYTRIDTACATTPCQSTDCSRPSHTNAEPVHVTLPPPAPGPPVQAVGSAEWLQCR